MPLQRIDAGGVAGLCVTSLPWPATSASALSLGGRPSYVQQIGQWPNAPANSPRRLLMVADTGGEAPATLSVTDAALVEGSPPTAEAEVFEHSDDERFYWERHQLRVRHGDRTIALRLGAYVGDEVHWWEACRLVEVDRTPFCRTVEMAGSIPRRVVSAADFDGHRGFNIPTLHEHNWLSGHLLVRLYANGVVEGFARHTNNKYVDEGGELRDMWPVVGLSVEGTDARTDATALEGLWDGSRGSFSLGAIGFDVAEAARLATPQQPGRMTHRDEVLVWQPYQGVEVYGGTCPQDRLGTPWIVRSTDGVFPRGMARTIRFSFSLSDRSPRIVRYLPPTWWYGLTQELFPTSALPVRDDHDRRIVKMKRWLHAAQVQGGFEDGAVPRVAALDDAGQVVDDRNEAGWEGEVTYGQFLLAYRSQTAEDYHAALRSSYYFTDVTVDHADKLVRMHGYPFPPMAHALPMNRVLGTLCAYLETGDPYLLQTAEAVTEAAYRIHLNSWPRLAVGRDACFARGAVMLYRYFASEHFRRIASEVCHHVAEVQREEGSFGDQGGGSGIHGWGAYITKPWMGLLATAPVLDYMELFPDEPRLEQCVLKFGDWLMKSRWRRGNVHGWSYQHPTPGQPPRWYSFQATQWSDLPGAAQWHQDSLGRLLAFCTLRTGDAGYLNAYAESLAGVREDKGTGDHQASATLTCIPRVQDAVWRPRLVDGRVSIHPLHFGELTPRSATIETPDGLVEVHWQADGTLKAPQTVLNRS